MKKKEEVIDINIDTKWCKEHKFGIVSSIIILLLILVIIIQFKQESPIDIDIPRPFWTKPIICYVEQACECKCECITEIEEPKNIFNFIRVEWIDWKWNTYI